MRWELDALKILSRNVSVPGDALRDAIDEIERLRTKLKSQEIIVAQQKTRINDLAEKLLKKVGEK